MGRGKGNFTLRVVGFVAILLFLSSFLNLAGVGKPLPLSLGDFGYTSMFEGPKATFYGVTWNPNGAGERRYSKTEFASGASMKQFDAVLRFDGDAVDSGYPDIIGEESQVFIPEESLGGYSSMPSWLPASWSNSQNYIRNPTRDPVNWTIDDKTYSMQQWTARYYVSFSAEGSGGAGLIGGTGEYPPQNQYPNGDNSYGNLVVWIEFDIKPIQYFEGMEQAYFAIGEVTKIDNAMYSAKTTSGGTANPRLSVSVSPESPGAALFLSYAPFFQTNDETHNSYYYQGKKLNPDYFTDKVFINIPFNHFGLYGDWNTPGNVFSGVWCRGDVVTIGFDVTIFVVGQWKVQDVQQDPTNFGRFVKADTSTWGLLSWLTAPATLAWLIPAAIFVAILLFAPWVLIFILALIGIGRRRR